MKRLFTAALSAALLLSLALPSSAAGTGRAVDWALYTDITAQINGHPLRSYNVNGSTAVVAEDLRGYGFQVLWDAEDPHPFRGAGRGQHRLPCPPGVLAGLHAARPHSAGGDPGAAHPVHGH